MMSGLMWTTQCNVSLDPLFFTHQKPLANQLHDFWRLDYWEDDLRRRRRFVRNPFGSTHLDITCKSLEDYGVVHGVSPQGGLPPQPGTYVGFIQHEASPSFATEPNHCRSGLVSCAMVPRTRMRRISPVYSCAHCRCSVCLSNETAHRRAQLGNCRQTNADNNNQRGTRGAEAENEDDAAPPLNGHAHTAAQSASQPGRTTCVGRGGKYSPPQGLGTSGSGSWELQAAALAPTGPHERRSSSEQSHSERRAQVSGFGGWGRGFFRAQRNVAAVKRMLPGPWCLTDEPGPLGILMGSQKDSRWISGISEGGKKRLSLHVNSTGQPEVSLRA
ncbi:hypothetical protein P4O66_003257 [Electrophorus voltai]|uniref:DUF1088 domain-containing protein n=1 Tax=Electrophorus voltai TaxID=2609070 RepID=A0AAD8YRB8_9TELE|nr:hypothetical protein P4O66_003257 [Electrophorus voltai]